VSCDLYGELSRSRPVTKKRTSTALSSNRPLTGAQLNSETEYKGLVPALVVEIELVLDVGAQELLDT